MPTLVRPYSLYAVRRRFLALFVGSLVPLLALAQSQPTGDHLGLLRAGIQSPTAAGLGKVAELPVSLYTGTPSIPVPLHTVKGRVLTVPVELTYQASGVKLEELPGWVGAGWSLQAGGVITRTTRGLPDDAANGYRATAHHLTGAVWDQAGLSYAHQWYRPSGADNAALFDYLEKARTQQIDPEPDQFFFNVNGMSGRFFFDRDGQIRTVPHGALRIEPREGAGSAITEWTVTTDDGTQYLFGAGATNGNATEYSRSAESEWASAWYLRAIRQADGADEITFEYTAPEWLRHPMKPYHEVSHTPVGSCGPGIGANAQGFVQTLYHVQEVRTVRLQKIISALETVEFVSTRRTGFMVADEFKLDEIRVKDKNQSLVRRFAFDYQNPKFYFADRLFLFGVQEYGRHGDPLPAYQFGYEAPSYSNRLRDRFSHSVDTWGYFNGKANALGIAETTYLDHRGEAFYFTGDNRRPSPLHAKIGVLTTITYPTGGKASFTYELNDAGYVGGKSVTTDVGPVQQVSVTAAPNPASVHELDIESPVDAPVSVKLTLETRLNLASNTVCQHAETGLAEECVYLRLVNEQGEDVHRYDRIKTGVATEQEELHLEPGRYALVTQRNDPEATVQATLTWQNDSDVPRFARPYRVSRTVAPAGASPVVDFNIEAPDGRLVPVEVPMRFVLDRVGNGLCLAPPGPGYYNWCLYVQLLDATTGAEVARYPNVASDIPSGRTNVTKVWHLPAGQYRLRATNLDTQGDSGIDASAVWANLIASNARPVGGLRMAEVRLHDGLDAANDVVTRYEYDEPDGRSSGVLAAEPRNYYVNRFDEYFSGTLGSCWTITRSSTYTGGLGMTQGHPVGYKQVKEVQADGGYTVHEFISAAHPEALEYDPNPPDPKAEHERWSYPVRTTYDFKRGKQRRSRKYEAGGTVQSDTQTDHCFSDSDPNDDCFRNEQGQAVAVPGATVWGYGLAVKFEEASDDGGGAGVTTRYYSRYRPISAWHQIREVRTTRYDQQGAGGLTARQVFTYSPEILQLKQLDEISPDGETRVTRYDYAAEYTAYRGMEDAHMLNRQYAITVKDGPGDVESKTWTTWSDETGYWRPWQTWAWTGAAGVGNDANAPEQPGGPETRRTASFEAYDAYGHVTQHTDARGYGTQYYYGDNANNLSNAGAALAHAYLTGVRRGHLTVQYDYDVGTGQVLETKDENGDAVRYAYDRFGRLESVSNAAGQIVTRYEYRLARETGSLGASTPNALVSYAYRAAQQGAPVQATAYFDGLGRPLQTHVENGASDVVVDAVSYDATGRVFRRYGPYAYAAGFHLNPYPAAASYANANYCRSPSAGAVHASQAVSLDLKAYLEGAYGAGAHHTALTDEGMVPVTQPYGIEPWTYDGTEEVTAIPEGVVDWVLLELRTGTTSAVPVSSRAAFIRTDGRVVDLDGVGPVRFDGVANGSYYVVLRHRTHLPVMSAARVDFTGEVGAWDFTTAMSKAFSAGSSPMKALGSGWYGLFAGDGTQDGQVTALDFNLYHAAATSVAQGYLASDFNMDGEVTALDFNVYNANTTQGAQSQVPEPGIGNMPIITADEEATLRLNTVREGAVVTVRVEGRSDEVGGGLPIGSGTIDVGFEASLLAYASSAGGGLAPGYHVSSNVLTGIDGSYVRVTITKTGSTEAASLDASWKELARMQFAMQGEGPVFLPPTVVAPAAIRPGSLIRPGGETASVRIHLRSMSLGVVTADDSIEPIALTVLGQKPVEEADLLAGTGGPAVQEAASVACVCGDPGRPYTQSTYRADATGRIAQAFAPGSTVPVATAFKTNTMLKWGVAETIDEGGYITRTYTDGWGRTRREERSQSGSPTLAQTNFVYDIRDHLIEVRSPEYAGELGIPATRYRYNPLGELVEKTSADAGRITYVYDKAGNLRFSQDARQREVGSAFNQALATDLGQSASYSSFTFTTYDGMNRPVAGGVLLGAPVYDPDATHTFETTTANWKSVNHYDAPPSGYPWSLFSGLSGLQQATTDNLKGRLAATASKASNVWQVELFAYDDDGRLSRKHIRTQNDPALNTEIHYSYDLQGNVTKRRVHVGTETVVHFYEYDQRGLLSGVFVNTTEVRPARAEARYTYLASGVVREARYGEYAAGQYRVALPYGYTLRDWVQWIGSVSAPGSQAFAASYCYAENGNITRADCFTDHPWTEGPGRSKRIRYDFAYDALGRLAEADQSRFGGLYWLSNNHYDVKDLAYDKNGNLKRLKRYDATGVLADDYSYRYTHGSNRLDNLRGVSTQTGDFRYDENGNLTKAPAPYSLSTIYYDERNLPRNVTVGGQTVLYRYSAGGQRYRKQAGAVEEHYVLDGATRLAVFVKEAGTWRRKHWNLLASGTIGRMDEDGEKRYYVKDHLGSTRAVVDDRGFIVGTYDYYPFGEPLPTRSSTNGLVPYEQFTGKERDTETGLDYFGARYYMPKIGRWTAVDPLADKNHSDGPYAYAVNNPLRFVDASGKDTLRVVLPEDRTREGMIYLIINGRVTGFAKVLGRGTTNGGRNPTRDPRQTNGDTPTGQATIDNVVDLDPDGNFVSVNGIPHQGQGGVAHIRDETTRDQLRAYGRYFIRLEPASGDFQNSGRTGIGIHGGGRASDALAPRQELRTTHGCLRVCNSTAASLADQVQDASTNNRGFRVIISEDGWVPTPVRIQSRPVQPIVLNR